jgi:hypothetical protein
MGRAIRHASECVSCPSSLSMQMRVSTALSLPSLRYRAVTSATAVHPTKGHSRTLVLRGRPRAPCRKTYERSHQLTTRESVVSSIVFHCQARTPPPLHTHTHITVALDASVLREWYTTLALKVDVSSDECVSLWSFRVTAAGHIYNGDEQSDRSKPQPRVRNNDSGTMHTPSTDETCCPRSSICPTIRRYPGLAFPGAQPPRPPPRVPMSH